ncbi:hypothetical protein QR680_003142 [Steinernema hermaphroditum]|uniref:Uncharacterized protein n=1 Tax=Steinernema hermaphroditum TaxID=289476 RepID=A0AA39H6G6_9BILA|nr:hypothetical protein QR680_003142 [Steinernema hermaphroditum]
MDTKQRSLTDSGLNMSSFMGLPGLIQSPELLQQIDQLIRESGSASGDAGCSYQQPETAPPRRSPYKLPSISQSALVSAPATAFGLTTSKKIATSCWNAWRPASFSLLILQKFHPRRPFSSLPASWTTSQDEAKCRIQRDSKQIHIVVSSSRFTRSTVLHGCGQK